MNAAENPTISEAQPNANRQNAEKSTSSKTMDGKDRAKLNGLRHGLTGQTIVMPYEGMQLQGTFCDEILADARIAQAARLSAPPNA